MLKIVMAALLGLTMASAASAETATLPEPIRPGSLQEGPLGMVAYWVSRGDGRYEVSATFLGRMPGDQPMRIVVNLVEGENVSFSMPGYPAALYRFARNAGVVDASVDMTSESVAAN